MEIASWLVGSLRVGQLKSVLQHNSLRCSMYTVQDIIHWTATFCLHWNPEVFSLTQQHDAKRRNVREPLDAHVRSFQRVWGETWENLWAHTLGPLNMPIQWEAIIDVSESGFDSKTLETASHWIGTFKPNMRPEVLSCLASSLHTRSWARKPRGTRVHSA